MCRYGCAGPVSHPAGRPLALPPAFVPPLRDAHRARLSAVHGELGVGLHGPMMGRTKRTVVEVAGTAVRRATRAQDGRSASATGAITNSRTGRGNAGVKDASDAAAAANATTPSTRGS